MTNQKEARVLDDNMVSIIIPVYNAGIKLVDALVSAQSQTRKALEIICVNDGSTDDSPTILRLFANEDPRIRIINIPNGGYGAAMNAGLQAARGTWISILEPDDWIDVDMLERMLAFAARFPEAPDVIKCPFWWVPPHDEFGENRLQCTYKGRIRPNAQPFTLNDAPELIAHHPSIWSALYRRAFLDQNSIRFPEYPGSGWADNRFLAETLSKAERIVYLDEAFYNYRASTPDKELAFIKGSPALPFERWMDITRVLEREHVTNARVMGAHARHGFTYLAQVAKAGVLESPDAIKAAQVMFNHMDERLVLADPAIAPEHRLLFAQMRGIECIKPMRLAHTGYLANEALRRVRVNGLRATLQDAKRVFS